MAGSARLPPKVRQRYPGEIMLSQFRNEIGLNFRLTREYGDTFRYKVGPFHVTVANHPDAIEQLLHLLDRIHRVVASQKHRLKFGEAQDEQLHRRTRPERLNEVRAQRCITQVRRRHDHDASQREAERLRLRSVHDALDPAETQ